MKTNGGPTAARWKNAFSMVEIIVALALIAVGLIPVFSLFGSTSSEISATIDEIILAGYANELIDAIINHPYDAIPGEYSSADITGTSDKFFKALAPKLSALKPGFKRGVAIKTKAVRYDPSLFQNLDPYSQKKFDRIKNIKIVRATISYQPVAGRPRTMEICAVVTAE